MVIIECRFKGETSAIRFCKELLYDKLTVYCTINHVKEFTMKDGMIIEKDPFVVNIHASQQLIPEIERLYVSECDKSVPEIVGYPVMTVEAYEEWMNKQCDLEQCDDLDNIDQESGRITFGDSEEV